MQGLYIVPAKEENKQGRMYLHDSDTPLNAFRIKVLKDLFTEQQLIRGLERYMSDLSHASLLRERKVERFNRLSAIPLKDYDLINTLLPFSYYATIEEEIKDIENYLDTEGISLDDKETYELLPESKEQINLLKKTKTFNSLEKLKTKIGNSIINDNRLFFNLIENDYYWDILDIEDYSEHDNENSLLYTVYEHPLKDEIRCITALTTDEMKEKSVLSYLEDNQLRPEEYLAQHLAKKIAVRQEHRAYKNTYYDYHDNGFKKVKSLIEKLHKEYQDDFNFKEISNITILSREDIEKDPNLFRGYKDILELQDLIKSCKTENQKLDLIYKIIEPVLKRVQSKKY